MIYLIRWLHTAVITLSVPLIAWLVALRKGNVLCEICIITQDVCMIIHVSMWLPSECTV